jgi:RNA polymerase sigma-70 factor (family 1)
LPEYTNHTESFVPTLAHHALVKRLRAGEVAAFTEIFDAFAERLLVYAVNILDNRVECEDLVQDVLLWLWQNREKLDPKISLEPFLFKAVRNDVFDLIRKGKVKERVFDQIEKRIWLESPAENQVYARELQAKLKEAIHDLPERVREVYQLSREEHLSHKEIAERLSISPKTVENQLATAMKKIRASLGDFLPLVLLFLNGK